MKQRDGPFKAVVKDIRVGVKGKYGVAKPEEGLSKTVTFSLEEPDGVWQEKNMPRRGNTVILDDLRLQRNLRGRSVWRAYSARFFRPSDREEESQ